MAEIDISQAEADELVGMPKERLDDKQWDYPGAGNDLEIPLLSTDKRERFFLDVARGRIEMKKHKFQTRGRHVITLLRLDFYGRPHRNPDGEEIPCPHLHCYKEGYGDKWAAPLDPSEFRDPESVSVCLSDFMRLSNIVTIPRIAMGIL